MRSMVIPILAMLAGCLSCIPASRPEHSVPEDLAQATAVVIGRDVEGELEGLCSGVWVGQVDLLTAAHCTKTFGVAGPTDKPVGEDIRYQRFVDMTAKGIGLEDSIGTVVAIDDTDDLALISTDRKGHGFVSVYRGVIHVGDPCLTMGHTYGYLYSFSRGMIEADRVTNDMHVLQVFSAANHGDSGGGCFTGDGELLGIGSFLPLEPASFFFYVHRNEVLAFLKKEGVLR